MFVQRVLNWISPQEKPEAHTEEKNTTTPEQSPEITKDDKDQSTHLQLKPGPSRNTADNIENAESVKKQPHENNEVHYKTFLEIGDVLGSSDRNNDKTKIAPGGVGDGIERPRTPKLSPLCARILQRSEANRRDVFTQTEGRRRRGKLTLNAVRQSPAGRKDQWNKLEEEIIQTTRKNPKIVVRSCESLKEPLPSRRVKAIGQPKMGDLKREGSLSVEVEEVVRVTRKAPIKPKEIPLRERRIQQPIERSLTRRVPFPEDPMRSQVATLLQQASEQCHKDPTPDPGVYGELLVLGCNATKGNRFVLRRRQKASGVKEASATYAQPSSVRKHTVSFQVSASRSVVVEYVRDTTTDMFQIGRHEHPPIDIRVTNTGGRKGVSRFACRMVIERHGDAREARVYAAAFDANGNIFLGEEASAGVHAGVEGMDGFTTNGVQLAHPGGEWREVSVRGRLYPTRTPGASTDRRRSVSSESNLLRDGSLIDLCGVTLLWRTADGLVDTPAEDCLDRMDRLLRELAPECHRRTGPPAGELHCCEEKARQTFVFLSCGHVVSMAVREEARTGWSCPECGCIGPVAGLRVGRRRGFYADRDLPSHAFRPCGHVATLRTVRYWSGVEVPPQGRNAGVCPFCGTKLNPAHKYVGLVYP